MARCRLPVAVCTAPTITGPMKLPTHNIVNITPWITAASLGVIPGSSNGSDVNGIQKAPLARPLMMKVTTRMGRDPVNRTATDVTVTKTPIPISGIR